MRTLALTECDSFQALISQRGIRPPPFKTNLEAMEAVELMATTCELGDRVLAFGRHGQIPEQQAEALIQDLITCFTSPVENARRIFEIGRELGAHEK